MKIIFAVVALSLLSMIDGRFVENPFIEGGELVPTGELPYQVYVTSVLKDSDDEERECSGSLIAPDIVLTSAVCVTDVRIGNVVVGEANIDNLSASQTADVLIIRNIKIHEDFDPETLENNIALLTLDRPARLKEGIIEVIEIATNETYDYVAERAWVSGWGNTGKLRKATGTVLTNLSCRVRYQNIQESQICAANNEQTPCIGDEGAPLVLQEDEDGQFLQIGVYSFIRDGDCESRWPAVYTKVASYADWIQENL